MTESENSSFSLVKYNQPVLAESDGLTLAPRALSGSFSASSRSPSSSSQRSNDLEEILNTILPPKEIEEDGKFWKQFVSMDESSRLEEKPL